MSEYVEPELEVELFNDAQILIVGAVTARRRGSISDVHFLLDSYMAEAKARGISREMCWAMLFAASTTWVDALVECRAGHHEQPVRETLTELGMSLAMQRG